MESGNLSDIVVLNDSVTDYKSYLLTVNYTTGYFSENSTQHVSLRNYSCLQENCTNSTGERTNLHVWSLTAVTVLLMTMGLWILTSNFMIITASICNKSLQTKTCMFLVSLAMADTMTAIFVPVAWMMYPMKSVHYFITTPTDLICRTRLFLMVFPLICSIYNILLVALDRYIALVHPLRYILFTKSWCRVLCFVSWTIAASIASLIFFWTRHKTMGRKRCHVEDLSPKYIHFCLGATFWTAFMLLIFMYVKIYLSISKSKRDLQFSKIYQKHNGISEKKISKMVFISIGVFLAMWTPLYTSFHLYIEHLIDYKIFYIFCILGYCNSGMNFFIYSSRSRKYKAAFRRICLCRTKQNKSDIILKKQNIEPENAERERPVNGRPPMIRLISVKQYSDTDPTDDIINNIINNQ